MTVTAIYARKSDDDGASVERQQEIATDFAVKQGWAVDPARVYSDNDVSGAVFSRPGLGALLAAVAAKPRPFDALVMMDSSRLGRDMAETLPLQLRITRAGVRVFHYQDGKELLVSTPTQKLVASVENFSHEDYRYQVQQKTRAALRKKAEQGHSCGARTFGYRTVPAGDHAAREVDPEQAAVVVRIFEMAAAGHGDRRIVNALAADGVPAPGSKGWSKAIVGRLLRNELFVGVAVYGKRGASPDEPIRTSIPRLRVVSEDLWRRVQARKAKTRQHYLRAADGRLLSKPEAGTVARYLLSGIARCWSCGGSLTGSTAKRGSASYYCRERGRRGSSFCQNGHGVPLVDLDESVRTSLHDLLANQPETVAALVEERDGRLRAEQATQGDRREGALLAAADLEKEIGNLVAALASGAASPDVTKAINERRARVEALKATPAPPPAFDRAEFFQRFAGVRRVAMLLESSYPSQVRQVLRKLGVERVTVSPDGAGWSFEGAADIGGLLDKDTPGGAGEAIRPARWMPS